MHSKKARIISIASFIVSSILVVLCSTVIPMPRVSFCLDCESEKNGQIYWDTGLNESRQLTGPTDPMRKANWITMFLPLTLLDLIPMFFYHPVFTLVMFIVISIILLAPIVSLIFMCIALSKPKEQKAVAGTK